MGHHAPYLSGFQIGYEDDTLANEGRGIVVFRYAGQDGARRCTEIDGGSQQLVGSRQFFAGFDPADDQMDLVKIVDGDRCVPVLLFNGRSGSGGLG